MGKSFRIASLRRCRKRGLAGGRAASAGLFVTLASHAAAMAPGSNIGAAHPVQLGGLPVAPPEGPEEAQPPSETPSAAKAVQDTAAWARSLAELRGQDVVLWFWAPW